MNIEDKIFKRYSPDYKKLLDFGFIEDSSGYKIEKNIFDNQFKAVISVDKKGKIKGKVFDLENDDEYLPFRAENFQGEFIGRVKDEYEKVLLRIRDFCYIKKLFIFPQTNRIANLISEKYNDEFEFPWEKDEGAGIIRNPKTKKWYALIMDVDKSKIQKDKKGLVEIINLKLSKDHVIEITKLPDFYPAYHMNKNHWITVILDESVKDEKIMELIEESYDFSQK